MSESHEHASDTDQQVGHQSGPVGSVDVAELVPGDTVAAGIADEVIPVGTGSVADDSGTPDDESGTTDLETSDAQARGDDGGSDDAAHDDGHDDDTDDADDEKSNDSDDESNENDDEDDDEDESGEDDEGEPEAGTGRSRGRGARVAQLEREGEVAADFLERLLDIADLDGDIDVDIDGDRAAVAIVDSEEGRVPRRLVGPDGRVLEALQELTRLAVQAATGERSRLMLDVAGYRADRRAALVKLARSAIEEVRSTGQSKALANMSAFERKVVHDEVTASGLHSESEGVEPHRHIVISAS